MLPAVDDFVAVKAHYFNKVQQTSISRPQQVQHWCGDGPPTWASSLAVCETDPLSGGATSRLRRCFHLHDVDYTGIRINVYDDRDVLSFVTFERVGVIDFIVFAVLVVGESLAIRADVPRHFAGFRAGLVLVSLILLIASLRRCLSPSHHP